MDKFERSSTEYCPHGTLCAVKASPLRASPIPAVARHGSPPCHGEDGGGAGNGHMPRGCACRALPHGKHSLPAKAYLLACETYGFAARNVWFRPAKPYLLPRPLRAVRPPPLRQTRAFATHSPRQKAAPRPMKRRKTGTFPAGAGKAERRVCPRLAGQARGISRWAVGRWNGRFWRKRPAKAPHAQGAGRTASGWARGDSHLAAQR